MVERAHEAASSPIGFPDERLRLLFVCAHPAIDAAVRTPLMLQTVLGLDAARIAAAFLVSPATMGQRLVRAKGKIRDAGIAFEVPERHELASRLSAALEAIYAAYGSGWEDVAGADPRRKGLADEAVWLGRLVAGLLPDEPEAHGLLALMLHCEARRGARRDADGAYVPLARQDVSRWSRALIDDAERSLTLASRAGKPGSFQLEAAIQSVHAHRAASGRTGTRSRCCTKACCATRPRSARGSPRRRPWRRRAGPMRGRGARRAAARGRRDLPAVLGAPRPPARARRRRGRSGRGVRARRRAQRGRGGARIPRRADGRARPGRWKTVATPVTIGQMSSGRFLLILLLTVALDLSSPVPQHHGATESVEEFEEVVHAQRGRRPFRHVRDTVAATVAREDRARELHRPLSVAAAPSRPTVTPVVIRKLPPSVAEPSSTPEDH